MATKKTTARRKPTFTIYPGWPHHIYHCKSTAQRTAKKLGGLGVRRVRITREKSRPVEGWVVKWDPKMTR